MEFTKLEIKDVCLIRPKKFGDNRGFFMETYKDDWFRKNISNVQFVQDNQSFSAQIGTIRGLHFQKPPYEQGKLVRVLKGAIFDVAVDIRKESPTYGKWVGANLSEENAHQLWIPAGFAHGFCTLTPQTEVFYKCTNTYNAQSDAGIAFDDKDIGITWPIDLETAILSEKDRSQPNLTSLEKV